MKKKTMYYNKYIGLDWYCYRLFNCSYKKFIEVMEYDCRNDCERIKKWLDMQYVSNYALTHNQRLSDFIKFNRLFEFLCINDKKNVLKGYE